MSVFHQHFSDMTSSAVVTHNVSCYKQCADMIPVNCISRILIADQDGNLCVVYVISFNGEMVQ